MKRYCQTITLRNDPELIRKYIEIHSHVWPEIIEGQHEVGILSMQIYAAPAPATSAPTPSGPATSAPAPDQGQNQAQAYSPNLFMIVDTVDDFDWQRDMARLATLPRQAEWEAYVSHFQDCDPQATSAEKWQPMRKIFDSEQ